MPQAFSLHRDLSVAENLRFTARLHRLPRERSSGARARRCSSAPASRRSPTARAGALSGGMKQKLAIANALLPAPGAPDPRRADRRRRRRRARRDLEHARTSARDDALVVVSTSYLDEAAACDRLVYLDDGRVVATGTPERAPRRRVRSSSTAPGATTPRAIARAARALPYVAGARARRRFARVEVPRAPDAGIDARPRAIWRRSASVRFVSSSSAPVDMESTLLALARGDDVVSRPDHPHARPHQALRRLHRRRRSRPSRSAPGTIFAFLGANGSGKSTTIRMLIGLLKPTAGKIEVDGVDVIRTPRRVRDHIGYMGQKVSLYQGLSLRENVEFYAGLYGLAGAALEQRWGALRERFALAEAETRSASDLPAGIRQRAGLALSTLHQPRVLFLDEPTAGVDVENRLLFWELIQDEARPGSRSSSPRTSSRRSTTATGCPSSTPAA